MQNGIWKRPMSNDINIRADVNVPLEHYWENGTHDKEQSGNITTR